MIDTYRTTADLGTVQYDVVSIGIDLAKAALIVHQFDMLRFWCSERMVLGIPAVVFFVMLKQREV
ncbi:hypothetical protein D9M68_883320 [compost metagenome]